MTIRTIEITAAEHYANYFTAPVDDLFVVNIGWRIDDKDEIQYKTRILVKYPGPMLESYKDVELTEPIGLVDHVFEYPLRDSYEKKGVAG